MKKDQIEPEKYPKIYQNYLEKEEKLAKDFLSGANSVLDVGCEPARLLPKIVNLVNSYFGLEINNEYFKIAKKRAERFRNARIIKLNAENISKKFKRNQFDKIICTWNTVGCLRNDKKIIKEIYKVTKSEVFFTVLLKGSLKERMDYYNKLKIKHTVDKENEIIKSRQWGVVKAYSNKDIEKLIEGTGFNIEKIKPINSVGLAIYLTK